MTELPQHHSPPSWFVPIAVGALFVILVQATIVVLGPVLGPAACCCCLIDWLPLGFLPAFVALRRDPQLSLGNGFAVAFIACGIGGLLVALPQAIAPDLDAIEEQARVLREGLQQAARDSDQQLSQEDIDTLVDAMVTFAPYASVLRALVLTVLGSLAGLATVAIFRRDPPPPPPQPAQGQQYPPPRI